MDDHQVVRKGFGLFLNAAEDLELAGEAVDGEDAIRQCEALNPDIVLMDMLMPKMDGMEATRIIRERFPDIQVIALTSFQDDRNLVQGALQAGAIGYLFKDISIDDLADAIRKAHSGTPILAPEATRMLIQASTEPKPQDFNLTERELEVLELLVEGLNNVQIAERLVVSRSTVKFHVSSILGKLGVSGRTEAVSVALQHNLLVK